MRLTWTPCSCETGALSSFTLCEPSPCCKEAIAMVRELIPSVMVSSLDVTCTATVAIPCKPLTSCTMLQSPTPI